VKATYDSQTEHERQEKWFHRNGAAGDDPWSWIRQSDEEIRRGWFQRRSAISYPASDLDTLVEFTLNEARGGRRTFQSITSSARLKDMCHNVHMKTISIRELHLETGRWVRHAATRGPIVVTDRGRRVAALQPFDASVTGRPLPNREAAIRKRSKVPVDSAGYLSELREER
jgi:antitoxin (DNA-binding transcriptional repressor) of toxin-antitoxin stability system